jgi:hypothetical protein
VAARHRGRAVLDHGAQLEGGVAVRRVEVGADDEVAEAHARLRDEGDVAEDPGEAPVVLVLEVAAVGVVQHLDGEDVRPRSQVPREVELAGGEGIFAVAEALAVQPHVVRRLDAGEVNEDAAALPVGRDLEASAIEPRRVVVVRHAGRVGRERVLDVREERPVVGSFLVGAHDLPVRRDGQRVPRAVVVAGLLEALGHGDGVLHPAEAPAPVQEADARRARTVP